MKVFVAGVSCVGKTAIGRSLAARLGCPFHDMDEEIEKHFGKPLAKLKAQALTPYSFRKEFASVVLKKIVQAAGPAGFVLALPPSGLMDRVNAVLRGKGVVVVLRDSPANILSRITFYDDDSRPISKVLTKEERSGYLKMIRDDIQYFARSFRRADITANIEGLGVEDAAALVERRLRDREIETAHQA